MNVKSIIIELEPENDQEKNHATLIKFENGMWEANGPMFPRFSAALNEVWKLIRGRQR